MEKKESVFFYRRLFPLQRERSPSERLVGKYDPKNFVSKVSQQDASGNELPQWKKMLIAKQLAEKALEEDEEQARVIVTGFNYS